jgi:hypothetical protein
LPAFLEPGKKPRRVKRGLTSVALLFANAPYQSLGALKAVLLARERVNVFFTQGLASIVLLNCSLERAGELREIAGNCLLEFWPIRAGILDVTKIVVVRPPAGGGERIGSPAFPKGDDGELAVYVEQITASLASLWASYLVYFPEELKTLHQVAAQVTSLVKLHCDIRSVPVKQRDVLAQEKEANAIVAALVEVSAALSYAVTQGTSGASPVLSNRAPFPHHSLFGIGGAVRALTKFTRYVESAFMVRSAGRVIATLYQKLTHVVPARIPEYSSGPPYRLVNPQEAGGEEFDAGGDLPQEDQVPLIAHFSLRHGFMESKFSVTAASEALTAATSPQWTLMTLSHEIMHSRVRTIFQAIFGRAWQEEHTLISKKELRQFAAWIDARRHPRKTKVLVGLRNVILHFCYAMDTADSTTPEKGYSQVILSDVYSRYKHLAIELFVHFHDYYFVYAAQAKLYAMSLWASWIKVAAPHARPREYLARSLATIACGCSLPTDEAFDYARDILLDGLSSLEVNGIKSPLFGELRRLVSGAAEGEARIYFTPCYYLIDTVRRYFASRTIASKIDRIESDPFAEGSPWAEDYSARIYVYGEGRPVSPIRYSMAALCKTLSGQPPVNDLQWLTAWNYLVISS